MESFAVDVDPGQVVRWVIAERNATPSSLKTLARRVTEVRDIAARSEYHLGDQEREDLSEVATIATLEIAPAHDRDGWLLTVTVEDESGPRTVGDSQEVAPEQQIDIGTFYKEFIQPGRGIANVVAQFEGPSARLNVIQLLETIERNQHPGQQGAGTSRERRRGRTPGK